MWGAPGRGNVFVRLAVWIVIKALRKSLDFVTFDREAFEAAVREVPEGAHIVLIPSHRSYLDFVLCSILMFARPDLVIAIPHIAATSDFARIPLINWLILRLHAFYIEPFERDGASWVRFDIHPLQNNTQEVTRCEAPIKERRVVRDSGGHEELRYVIETPISIGGRQHLAEVTLTDRDTMKFRALLGRTAIRRKYMVDPGKSYLLGKRKRKPRATE